MGNPDAQFSISLPLVINSNKVVIVNTLFAINPKRVLSIVF